MKLTLAGRILESLKITPKSPMTEDKMILNVLSSVKFDLNNGLIVEGSDKHHNYRVIISGDKQNLLKCFSGETVEAKSMFQYSKHKINEDLSGEDTLTFDVPTLTRLLEISKENLKSDDDLHKLLSKLIKVANETISMDSLTSVIGESLFNISNIDDLSVDEIHKEFLATVDRCYPNFKGKFVTRSDGTYLRAEIPGKDKLFATLNLDTGKINLLGD